VANGLERHLLHPARGIHAMRAAALALLLASALNSGCSVRNLAVNSIGDALAASGSGFGSDDDPQLIAAAAPFSLKLIESVLAESPGHQGLLLAAAQGFTQYAYAFVHLEADPLEHRDLAAANALRERARRLYLRARDYGMRGLEAKRPGFSAALRADPALAMRRLETSDVALVYWTAASWAAAISLSKDRPDVIADLGLMEALMERALQLDESYDHGAIHVFFISYAASRPHAGTSPHARAREHFERAVALSQEKQAGPYVALAEAVCIASQDRREFERLLRQALAVDIEARPQWKLANLVVQRRARWLLAQADQFFSE